MTIRAAKLYGAWTKLTWETIFERFRQRWMIASTEIQDICARFTCIPKLTLNSRIEHNIVYLKHHCFIYLTAESRLPLTCTTGWTLIYLLVVWVSLLMFGTEIDRSLFGYVHSVRIICATKLSLWFYHINWSHDSVRFHYLHLQFMIGLIMLYIKSI